MGTVTLSEEEARQIVEAIDMAGRMMSALNAQLALVPALLASAKARLEGARLRAGAL